MHRARGAGALCLIGALVALLRCGGHAGESGGDSCCVAAGDDGGCLDDAAGPACNVQPLTPCPVPEDSGLPGCDLTLDEALAASASALCQGGPWAVQACGAYEALLLGSGETGDWSYVYDRSTGKLVAVGLDFDLEEAGTCYQAGAFDGGTGCCTITAVPLKCPDAS